MLTLADDPFKATAVARPWPFRPEWVESHVLKKKWAQATAVVVLLSAFLLVVYVKEETCQAWVPRFQTEVRRLPQDIHSDGMESARRIARKLATLIMKCSTCSIAHRYHTCARANENMPWRSVC